MMDPGNLSRQRDRNETIVANAVPKALSFMKESIVRNIEYTEYSVVEVGF